MELSNIITILGWHKKLDDDTARTEVADMILALCRIIQKGNFSSLITNIQFDGDKTILLMFDGKQVVYDPSYTVPILVYPKIEITGDNSRSPLFSYEKKNIADGSKSYEGVNEDDMT